MPRLYEHNYPRIKKTGLLILLSIHANVLSALDLLSTLQRRFRLMRGAQDPKALTQEPNRHHRRQPFWFENEILKTVVEYLGK